MIMSFLAANLMLLRNTEDSRFVGEIEAPSYFLEWRTWRTSSEMEIKVQSFRGAL